MQKWEYLFVSVETYGEFRAVWWASGRNVEHRKPGVPIFELAEELGDQGWELVAAPITKDFSTDTFFKLIFKRPKA